MAFSILTILYDHHLYGVPKHFHPSKENPVPLVTPHHPSSQPLAATKVCSVPMDFPSQVVSCKCNNIVCELFCLTSFT